MRQDSADQPEDSRQSKRRVAVWREPMHGQILPHLRQDIITGRWRPGDRLPEPGLCREFNVSRTPLRDALRVLEAEGLVRMIPHVGAVVTEATGPDIGEKMELLTAIEQFAAFKLAQLGTSTAVQRIERLHAEMQEAAARTDASLYYRLNDDFHRTIVLGTGNRSLADAHERVMWHVHRARHLANMHEPLSQNAALHHQGIVDGIVRRDPDAAERAMREHLAEVAQIIARPTASDAMRAGAPLLSAARGSRQGLSLPVDRAQDGGRGA